MVDALRGREPARTPPPAETTAAATAPDPSPALVERLRAAGVEGTLILVTPDCRVRTLRLPDLARSARAPADSAGLTCSPPARYVTAPCGVGEEPECLPAQRPDGDVVVARRGGLWAGDREVLSRDDLHAAGVVEPRILDQTWLSQTHVAVVLAGPGGGYVLALFDGTELVASHRWGGAGPVRLDKAPGGGLFSAPPARVFRRDGAPLTLAPRFRNARALAWSPDARWAALAMTGAIVVVPVHGLVGGADARRAIRIPYAARDLAWREASREG